MPNVPPFRIGDWLVQPDLNLLQRETQETTLEPRVMKVLVLLAQSPGEVVERRTVLDAVWPDAVVNEDVLTRAVYQLRRAFDDSSESPRYIQTIRKGGYRLLAPVAPIHSDTDSSGHAAVPSTGDTSGTGVAPSGQQQPTTRWLFTAARFLLLPIALILVVIWITNPEPDELGLPFTLNGIPLTTSPGQEVLPALDAGGTRVAYAGKPLGGRTFDIYIQQIGEETALRLTDNGGDNLHPVWSPNGAYVAYLHRDQDGYRIHSVPSIGGNERVLTEPMANSGSLDWSPDGTQLAYSWQSGPDQPSRLLLLDLGSLHSEDFTTPHPNISGDFQPRFAPDGTRLAFVRVDEANISTLCLLDLNDRTVQPLTAELRSINGLDWFPDGEGLIVAASPQEQDLLWRVRASDGAVRQLPTRSSHPFHPTVAAETGHLVYDSQSSNSNIWQIDLDPTGPRALDGRRLIESTRPDLAPAWSPTGDRIAFISARSGNREIWLCQRDGSSPRRLTSFDGAFLRPRLHWSPNGSRIAVTAKRDEFLAVCLATVATGQIRCFQSGDYHERASGWSNDGEWIYLSSNQPPRWQVWRLRVEDEARELLLGAACSLAGPTGPGKTFTYWKLDQHGVFRSEGDGTPERHLADPEVIGGWIGEAVTADGMFYTRYADGTSRLHYLDFASGRRDSLYAIPGTLGNNLHLSPDGTSLLLDLLEDLTYDLVLVGPESATESP